MLRQIFLFFLLPILLLAMLYTCTTIYLLSQTPNFSLAYMESHNERTTEKVPFFNLMISVPKSNSYSVVPKLEYRPGPPKRFFYRFSYFYWEKGEKKEQIDYYGRKTKKRWFFPLLPLLTPFSSENYSSFVEASLRYAFQHQWNRKVEEGFPLLGRLLFLYQTKLLLGNFIQKKNPSHRASSPIKIYVMKQANQPAFLLLQLGDASKHLDSRALMKFYRRESVYRVQLHTEKESFSILEPKKIFSQSFLIDSRKKALAHIGGKLSQVRIKKNQSPPKKKELELPLVLLGSKLSLDPSSISALFHFTGISTLLFKHYRHVEDLEVRDSLRNNVLVAKQYAKDISPKSPQTREINRLARLIQQF